MPSCLTPARLAHDLAITDLSDPADGPHAIEQAADLLGMTTTAVNSGLRRPRAGAARRG
jgi:hypothetical protein